MRRRGTLRPTLTQTWVSLVSREPTVSAGIHRVVNLEPTLAAPAEARRAVRTALGPGLPPATTDLAELLTSELVTNAIRHGSGEVMLVLNCSDGMLAISVSDDAPTMPFVAPEKEPLAVGGRGVRMVQRLAQDWGVTPRERGPGKVVWFRLPA
jgi:anti-sigma regulatory factor (Ser/Thr protein kinase)